MSSKRDLYHGLNGARAGINLKRCSKLDRFLKSGLKDLVYKLILIINKFYGEDFQIDLQTFIKFLINEWIKTNVCKGNGNC